MQNSAPNVQDIQVQGNIWGNSYEISHPGGVIQLKAAVLIENTSFQWSGDTFHVRRSGPLSLVLRRAEEDLARSTVNHRERTVELRFKDRFIILQREKQRYGSPIRLIENHVQIGTFGPRRRFNRAFAASMPADVPIPVQIFAIYLVAVS